MKFRTFTLITLLIISLGCASPVQPSPTATYIFTPVPLQPSPTSVVAATDSLPIFQVENRNPPQRVIKFSELDLKSTTRVLLFDPKTEHFLSISNQSINPLPNARPEMSLQLDTIRLSPDHRWFAYLEINDGFNIWINSVDGSQHFMGISNAVGSTFRWLSNDKIAVYDKLGGWADCPSALQIFDPFSKEVNNIPDISSEGIEYCFPIPYFNSDFTQGLYLDSDIGWQTYDYKAQTSYAALSGLDTSPGGNKYFFRWGGDGLSFAVPHQDRISFASNLTNDDLSSVLLLKTILLPQDSINENGFFEFWIPEKQLAGFELVGNDDNNVLDCAVTQTFVLVNLTTQTLSNYCLNQAVFSNQIGSAWFTYISADYRFAGWTVHELPSNTVPLGTVILDLETGKVSYLEGYEFLGFGEVPP